MAAGYGAAIKLIAGGIQGGLNGIAANNQRSNILAAYSHLPQVPNLKSDYLKGFYDQIQATPQLLNLDQSLRAQYLPQEDQEAANLMKAYLPQFASANLGALNKVDPDFMTGRNQLFGTVSGQLAQGTNIDPATDSQLVNEVRGAQQARGNVLGNAPAQAEALYQGQYGQGLLQQREGAMESFLNGVSPEDKFGELAGVGSGALAQSTGSATSPGYQFIQGPNNWAGNFENADQTQWQDAEGQGLAVAGATAAAGPQVNPWLSSLSGGLGALAGTGGGSSGGGGGGFSFGGGGGGGSPGYGGIYSGYSAGGMGDAASPSFL